MDKTINNQLIVHTIDFNNLYKRLLLQPISFSVCAKEYGGDIIIHDADKVDDLIEHIAKFTSDMVFNMNMLNELSALGITETWIHHKLISQLTYKNLNKEWYVNIKDDIESYIQDSLTKGTPLKLTAYARFGAIDNISTVKKFAHSIESVVFDSLVVDSVKTYTEFELNQAPVEKTTLKNVTFKGVSCDQIITTNIQGNEMVLLNRDDISELFLDTVNEIVYRIESTRYEEVQLYMYVLILMATWDTPVWNVEKEIYDHMATMVETLGLNVNIAKI